ncbi:MAG: TetR-family transcriptional regulator [Nocardia sp.]|uniref:TetR/AcrR family transcriptional regulator n=1 Tax=Nocardia sp. TaxID=1821 RepID=UPI002635B469|nr:TetR family transcriptional regulator [Nocardia sp.]MCU1643090.1 TetR-family transcriptional regulator [Nocardia sp.]
MNDGDLGLRERKKRETRLALSLATIRLSVEHGWDNVTVDDIAAAANVSVRTFRNYFSSKAEAVASRHLERMQQVAEELLARPESEALWEAIPAAVLARFALGQDMTAAGPQDEHWMAGIRLMLSAPAVQAAIVEANVAAQQELTAAVAVRTGTDPERELYPKLVAASVIAACAVVVEHIQRSDSPGLLLPLLVEALTRLAAGLPEP